MEQKKENSQELFSKEEYSMPSRAEYIRIARESCTRNLGQNHGNKNHYAKEKDKYPYKVVTRQDFIGSMTDTRVPPLYNIKVLLVRVICAAFLFLSVFLMDTFEFSYKTFNSEFVKELVATNRGVEQAQDFIVALLENLNSFEKGKE